VSTRQLGQTANERVCVNAAEVVGIGVGRWNERCGGIAIADFVGLVVATYREGAEWKSAGVVAGGRAFEGDLVVVIVVDGANATTLALGTSSGGRLGDAWRGCTRLGGL
jgi:hypothetical protein